MKKFGEVGAEGVAAPGENVAHEGCEDKDHNVEANDVRQVGVDYENNFESAETEEEEDENQIENVRAKITESETKRETAAETRQETENDKLNPEAMFVKYTDADVREEQQRKRPISEKLVNRILENDYSREFRQEREDELVEGVISLLVKAQEGGKIESVVDLGCGQGRILKTMMDYLKEDSPGVKAIGIDNKTNVSDEDLGDSIAFVRGDATDSKLADGSVDLVNVNYLLQALNEEMQKRVLEEVKRIMSEKGHMLFMDVMDRGGKDGLVDMIKHKLWNSFAKYNIRTEKGWEDFLEENGFEIEEKTKAGDCSVAFLVRVKKVKA